MSTLGYEKVCDGYEVFKHSSLGQPVWPEFYALLAKLGLTGHEGNRFHIHLTEEKAEIEPKPGIELPDGRTVFHWPEFQALARRLGAPVDTFVKGIAITIAEGEEVRVVVDAIAVDVTRPKDGVSVRESVNPVPQTVV